MYTAALLPLRACANCYVCIERPSLPIFACSLHGTCCSRVRLLCAANAVPEALKEKKNTFSLGQQARYHCPNFFNELLAATQKVIVEGMQASTVSWWTPSPISGTQDLSAMWKMVVTAVVEQRPLSQSDWEKAVFDDSTPELLEHIDNLVNVHATGAKLYYEGGAFLLAGTATVSGATMDLHTALLLPTVVAIVTTAVGMANCMDGLGSWNIAEIQEHMSLQTRMTTYVNNAPVAITLKSGTPSRCYAGLLDLPIKLATDWFAAVHYRMIKVARECAPSRCSSLLFEGASS